MFVLKNAWAAIGRHPWRNVLLVVTCIAASALSVSGATVIKADQDSKTTGYEVQPADAIITPKKGSGAKPQTWKQYNIYAQVAQSSGMQYSAYFYETSNVKTKGLHPASDESGSGNGVFSLVGVANREAENKGPHGSVKVVKGKDLDFTSSNPNMISMALISESTAQANKTKVGDSFKIVDPKDPKKTTELKVAGIYKDHASDAKAADAVYVNYQIFSSGGFDTASEPGAAGHELHVAFKLQSPAIYREFVKMLHNSGLEADKYDVTSPSLEAYARKMEPLHQAAGRVKTGLAVIWVVAGLALALLLALTLSNRANEIGMGVTVGVHKARMGWQFSMETLMVTLPGLLVGLGLGAGLTKPAMRAIGALKASAQVPGWDLIGRVGLYGLAVCAVIALIAAIRVFAFRTSQLYANDLEETA